MRVRGTVGWEILKELAPFVGAGVQYRVPIDGTTPVLMDDDVATVFPSLFAGVQF